MNTPLNLKAFIAQNGFEAVLGRVVISRSYGAWRVTGRAGEDLRVARWHDLSTTGRLDSRTFGSWRVYPSTDEVNARYPRLISLLVRVSGLSLAEAEDTVHGYLTMGRHYIGTEAVACRGGVGEVIDHALVLRHRPTHSN